MSLALRSLRAFLVLAPLVAAAPAQARSQAQDALTVFDEAVRFMRTVHPAPYRIVGREAFDQRVATERAGLAPDSDDAALAVAIWRVNSFLCDGHSTLSIPRGTSPRDRIYPIRFVSLGGELRVRAVHGLDERAVGARVLEFYDLPWEEARRELLTVARGDNEHWAEQINAPLVMEYPRIVAAIGLARPNGTTSIRLESLDGERFRLPLAPMDLTGAGWTELQLPSGSEAMLYQRDQASPHWVTTLPDHGAVYAQYNRVNNGTPTTESFAEAITAALESSGAETLIVDVRQNGGGNNYRNTPILHAILKNERVNRPGHLFVLTSPRTFSACMNFCGWLERETNAIFVGEPTGAPPSMYGDTEELALDRPGWTVRTSALYWQESQSNDERLWIEPYVRARLTIPDVLAGRDPVLDAALHFDDPEIVRWLENTAPRGHWYGPIHQPAIDARMTWPPR